MKRALALAVVVALAAAGVVAIEDLRQDRQYRRLMAEGDLSLAQGRTYAAIEAFSGALALRPTSMAAFYRRGEAYAAEGAHSNALRDLTQAHQLAPDAPQPLAALGRLHEARGDAAVAAEWYARAAERGHDADSALLYALALARYRSGSPAEAREPLGRLIAQNGGAAEAHYLLGVVERDVGDPEAALVSLEQAVRLAPSLLSAREELADLYRERGRLDDERMQRAILATLEPELERLLALSDTDTRRGEFDEALAALARAEGLQPQHSRIALARGRVHLARAERTGDRGAARQAIAELEQALGGTARRSEGLALLGRALFLAGDPLRAEQLLQDAIATSPVEPDAFAYLADAAEALGHAAAARDALVRLDALEGETVPVATRAARTRRLGMLALAARDFERAAELLAAAVASCQEDAQTMGLLAEARWASGDREGARASLAHALALDRDHPALRRLARTIR